jgi:cGMP-dependent protein kinase 2
MQYASFQDKYHLYFLFDLLPGGDLMDVLVSEAKVITHSTGSSALPCLATKTKYLKVCAVACSDV